MARILLTGASAFSGLWIAEALRANGHEVIAPLKRAAADYAGLRAERVARLRLIAEVVFETPFQSAAFQDLAGSGGFDVLAHHAADIPDYRSSDYDVGAGVERNTAAARAVLGAFAGAGGRAVIVTGTTFQAGEGGGGEDDLAVSPYGLSKGLTNQAFRHFARWAGLGFGEFIIAAPFGVLEEGRFAWSLFQNWFAGRPGVVRTPLYIRDNIPAPLLGEAYARLAGDLAQGGPDRTARPQGFVGAQGDFAQRLAAEARPRLGLPCRVDAQDQTAFPEPESRVNREPALRADWDAKRFWDDYCAYYQRISAQGMLSAPA